MRSSTTYDDNGHLPIHRAVFNGYEVTLKNILDDAQKRNELTQQLEAKTERTELTPLLLAVAVGRISMISFLLKYSVNINAVDASGHGKYVEQTNALTRTRASLNQLSTQCAD